MRISDFYLVGFAAPLNIGFSGFFTETLTVLEAGLGTLYPAVDGDTTENLPE